MTLAGAVFRYHSWELNGYTEVSINIRSNTWGEAATLEGFNREGDLHEESSHQFFVQIEMFSDRFDRLVSELSHSDAELRIHISTEKFRNFYATWSPSISEGRVIKFLGSKRDIENQEDIPEDFWGPTEDDKMFINPLETLASISVKRNTVVPTSGPQAPAPVRVENNDAGNDDYTDKD